MHIQYFPNFKEKIKERQYMIVDLTLVVNLEWTKMHASGQSYERFSWPDFVKEKNIILSQKVMKEGNFDFYLLTFTLVGRFIYSDEVAFVHS